MLKTQTQFTELREARLFALLHNEKREKTIASVKCVPIFVDGVPSHLEYRVVFRNRK